MPPIDFGEGPGGLFAARIVFNGENIYGLCIPESELAGWTESYGDRLCSSVRKRKSGAAGGSAEENARWRVHVRQNQCSMNH